MEQQPTKRAGDWKRRESLPSALLQIAVVALVLAGGVFLVYGRGAAKKDLNEQLRAARAAAVHGNYVDVKLKALPRVLQALEKSPGSGEANALAAALYTDLAVLHREPGAEQQARAYLDKAKKADAQTDDRYGTEAEWLWRSGDLAGAADFVEALRKKGASGARLFWVQALAHQQQGNLPLAGVGLTAAMDKAWRDGNYACAWGELLLEEAAPGAIDAFNKVLTQNDDLVRAKLDLALAWAQRREHQSEVEALLKQLVEKGSELSAPQQARILTVRAGLELSHGQASQAVAFADQALSGNPDDLWAGLFKARALAAQKAPAAVATFAALVKKTPWAPVVYFEGAAALQQAGFPEAALGLLAEYEAFFKQVRNTTADGQEVAWLDRDDRYWLTRGELLREAGKAADALKAYDKAIAAHGLNLARASLAKSQLLVSQGQLDQAAELLVPLTPQDGMGSLPEAYLAMGELLFGRKEWAAGCQNFAFALTRLKGAQAPKERLAAIVADVDKKLLAARQGELEKLWREQASPLAQ